MSGAEERGKAIETQYFRQEFRQSSSRARFSSDLVERVVP